MWLNNLSILLFFLIFCFYENISRTPQNIFSSVLICLPTNNEFPVVQSLLLGTFAVQYAVVGHLLAMDI